MLTLNIISVELKKENRIKSIYQSSKKLMLIFFISLAIYAIVLLSAKFVLQNHFAETIQETSLLTQNTANYSKQVDTINSQISSIEAIQNDVVNWSYLIEFFSNNLPDGIILNGLQANKDTKIINLAGIAKTREDLLLLKKFLEDSENFANVSLPIKTLLEKKDINFSIKTTYLKFDFDE